MDFAATIARAGLVVDSIGIVGASMEARLQALMGQCTEAIGAFA